MMLTSCWRHQAKQMQTSLPHVHPGASPWCVCPGLPPCLQHCGWAPQSTAAWLSCDVDIGERDVDLYHHGVGRGERGEGRMPGIGLRRGQLLFNVHLKAQKQWTRMVTEWNGREMSVKMDMRNAPHKMAMVHLPPPPSSNPTWQFSWIGRDDDGLCMVQGEKNNKSATRISHNFFFPSEPAHDNCSSWAPTCLPPLSNWQSWGWRTSPPPLLPLPKKKTRMKRRFPLVQQSVRGVDDSKRAMMGVGSLVGNSNFWFQFLEPPSEVEFQFHFWFQKFWAIFFNIPISGKSENQNSDLRNLEDR